MTVLDQRMNHSVLEAVLRGTEPLGAVYLGAAPEVANEYRLAWETRWQPLAAALREQGADEPTVAALEAAVAPPASSRAARGSGHVVAFARDGHVLGMITAPGLAGPDLARFSAPAHVLPLLLWQEERPPYVLVVTDRTGADLEECAGAGLLPVRSTVEGPDDEIERNAPGGWQGLTQGRYQRRAEDSWAHNAGAVAGAAVAALRRVEAKILVVSGDVRAEQLLRDKLPAWVHKDVTVKHIHGSRSADGSQRSRDDIVAAAVRDALAEQRAALWERFVEEGSANGLGVSGAHATLAALAQGRVGTLIVAAHPDDLGVEAWFGAGATEVQATDQPDPLWPGARRGPLVDVAVRAALLTGADVRVLPAEAGYAPERGIGGICRFH